MTAVEPSTWDMVRGDFVVVVVVDKGETVIMIRCRVDDRVCRRESEDV